MNTKKLAEIFVIILLFIVFCFTFGYPSFKRYMDQKVVVDESKIISKEFPSITICMVRYAHHRYLEDK